MCFYYCHNTHLLSNNENEIKLLIQSQKSEELVLFTYEANNWKNSATSFNKNDKIKILCPVCLEELDSIAPCMCSGVYFAIYTNKKRSYSQSVSICNNWGCKNSLYFSAWKAIKSFGEKSFSIL